MTNTATTEAALLNYAPWTAKYSDEQFDRAQQLAIELTDFDRKSGADAPAFGYSAERYKQAAQVVRQANRYMK